MRVLAVTSWGGACGIAQYAQQLIEAVGQANPDIQILPSAEALDSAWGIPNAPLYDLVWLNYHRGLHSRWDVETVHRVRQQGTPIAITFHDTFGERPPDEFIQRLHDLANAFVVHEPCVGLPKQILLRQGVPAPQLPKLMEYVEVAESLSPTPTTPWLRLPMTMPVLGTAGFNFPWKNFDRLAEVTAEAGWAYLVCSNNATDADVARWTAANPHTCVVRGFQPTSELVSYLAGCDATCWAYECANSGTSGAIRLGLAARKPVIAWGGCRQFRDLMLAEVQPGARSPWGIRWCHRFADLPGVLSRVPIQRLDPGIVQLAHRDSWAVQGARYAAIFRECCP